MRLIVKGVTIAVAVLALASAGSAGKVDVTPQAVPKPKPTVLKPADQAPLVPAQQPAQTVAQPAGTRAGEEINWQVLAAGGGMQTIGSLVLGSTIGQSFAGRSTVGANILQSGYWQNWSSGQYCCVIRGDVNHDGGSVIDISDLTYMVAYMFAGGPEPICLTELDVNGSGGIPDISDLVYMVAYMFQAGPAPVPCP